LEVNKIKPLMKFASQPVWDVARITPDNHHYADRSNLLDTGCVFHRIFHGLLQKPVYFRKVPANVDTINEPH
jgi:hypothetical protein